MSSRRLVINGYRSLIRQARSLFNKDKDALVAAKLELRNHFEESRHETDPQKIKDRLGDIDDLLSYMKNNIVQAVLNEQGNYETAIPGTDKKQLDQDKDAFAPINLSDVEDIEKRLGVIGEQDDETLAQFDRIRRDENVDEDDLDSKRKPE